MKKFLPFLVTAIVVAAVAFYGGVLYQQNSVQANVFQGGFGSGQRQVGAGAGLGAGRGMMGQRAGGQGGNFINGDIISKDDKSVTVKLRDGGSKIVFLSDSTRIVKSVDLAVGDLTVGEPVMVTGTANADGSLTAQNVQIRPNLPVQK